MGSDMCNPWFIETTLRRLHRGRTFREHVRASPH